MSAPSLLLSARALRVEVAGRCLVKDFDLDLRAGDCLAVLGRNGVGKSSLLATLAGLQPAAAGALSYAGRALQAYSPRELAQQRAWLAQNQEDAFAASVLETVLIGRHPWLSRFAWESAEDLALARAALDEVGLAGFASRNVQHLSGGERQRVALAALRVQAAPVWLLDEPVNHLDTAWQLATLQAIASHAAEGGAAMLVLHDVNLALRSCNRFLLLLDEGLQVLCGADALRDAALVSRLWGHPARALAEGDGAVWFVPQ